MKTSRPAPREFPVPRSMWGKAYSVAPRDARYAHIHVVAEFARDGALVMARCDACGGRFERVLVLHVAEDGTSPELTADPGAWVARIDAWRHLHQSCVTRPLPFTMPPLVQAFVDGELANARVMLSRSKHAGGLLTCFLASGALIGFRINDIEPTTPDRPRDARADEWEARKAAMRRAARQCRTEIVAAVAISEGWAASLPTQDGGEKDHTAALDAYFALPWNDPTRHASLHPEKREVLLVTVGTPDFAYVAFTPIERASGQIEVGPGTIKTPVFQPVITQCSILDGLFATRVSAESDR